MNKSSICIALVIVIFYTGMILSVVYAGTDLRWVGGVVNLFGWIPWGIGFYGLLTKKGPHYNITINLDKK